jgi:hypothetical protein
MLSLTYSKIRETKMETSKNQTREERMKEIIEKMEEESKKEPPFPPFNWYDIKIFPGSMEEFREIYGQGSEFVKVDSPYQTVEGRYPQSEINIRHWRNAGLSNQEILGLPWSGFNLYNLLLDLNADGIIRREIIPRKIDFDDSFKTCRINESDYTPSSVSGTERFFNRVNEIGDGYIVNSSKNKLYYVHIRGIPVRSEELSNRLKLIGREND